MKVTTLKAKVLIQLEGTDEPIVIGEIEIPINLAVGGQTNWRARSQAASEAIKARGLDPKEFMGGPENAQFNFYAGTGEDPTGLIDNEVLGHPKGWDER